MHMLVRIYELDSIRNWKTFAWKVISIQYRARHILTLVKNGQPFNVLNFCLLLEVATGMTVVVSGKPVIATGSHK